MREVLIVLANCDNPNTSSKAIQTVIFKYGSVYIDYMLTN